MTAGDGRITEEDPLAALAIDFSETARALFSAGTLEDTLEMVLRVGLDLVEGCEFIGIFFVEGDEIVDSVATDSLVGDVETLEHRLGEGPGLDAIAESLAFFADELGEDPRWPRFGPQASAKGVRSLLALPVIGNTTSGVLSFYARYPQAFGVVDRAKGLLLATLAGIASSAARSHANEQTRADNLHAALVTRELIGQAQGILIERERITADQAFAILRQASQFLNVKLREVAQHLVDTGERPDTGPRTAT